jgi:hypothetical protein
MNNKQPRTGFIPSICCLCLLVCFCVFAGFVGVRMLRTMDVFNDWLILNQSRVPWTGGTNNGSTDVAGASPVAEVTPNPNSTVAYEKNGVIIAKDGTLSMTSEATERFSTVYNETHDNSFLLSAEADTDDDTLIHLDTEWFNSDVRISNDGKQIVIEFVTQNLVDGKIELYPARVAVNDIIEFDGLFKSEVVKSDNQSSTIRIVSDSGAFALAGLSVSECFTVGIELYAFRDRDTDSEQQRSFFASYLVLTDGSAWKPTYIDSNTIYDDGSLLWWCETDGDTTWLNALNYADTEQFSTIAVAAGHSESEANAPGAGQLISPTGEYVFLAGQGRIVRQVLGYGIVGHIHAQIYSGYASVAEANSVGANGLNIALDIAEKRG